MIEVAKYLLQKSLVGRDELPICVYMSTSKEEITRYCFKRRVIPWSRKMPKSRKMPRSRKIPKSRKLRRSKMKGYQPRSKPAMRASGVVGKRQRVRKVIKKLAVRQSWINLQCEREHRQLCPQMQERYIIMDSK